MKFVCDSCHAQYLISDEKVGPNGVIVRCKKCQHKIVVKRATAPEEREETVVADNPVGEQQNTADNPMPPPAPPEAAAAGAGIDDELGRAFESVLSHQSPVPDNTNPGDSGDHPTIDGMPFISGTEIPAQAAAGPGSLDDGGDGDVDRQSTRVVNLNEMASMMKAEVQQEAEQADAAAAAAASASERTEEKPRERKNGSNGGAAATGAAGADWFVAINDSQVGPLNLDGVREKWDKGELSADSLCWKPGMADWKPLSMVTELADKLAPRPPPTADKEVPAGATATGAQAAAPAPLPPQQGEPGEPEWKPSAASALESLVKDELDSMQKPPPKEEAPAGGSSESKPHGLFDELPESPDKAEAAQAGEQSMQRNGLLQMEEEPPPPQYPTRRPGSRPPYASQPPEYAEPPPMYMAPPRQRTGLYIMLGIMGGLMVICATVVVVVVMIRQPQQQQLIAPVQNPPVPVPSNPPPTSPKTPDVVAKTPDTAKPPEKVPEPAKPAEPDKKDDTKVATGPDTKPGDKTPGKDTKPVDKGDKAGHNPKGGHPGQKVASTEPKEPKEPKEPAVAKEPEEKPQPKGKQKGDDFDEIFGGGGGDKTEKAPAEKKGSKPKDVYIPPAPGSGGGKATLEQGDVMEVVVGNKDMIKACTNDAKAKDPGATGTIVMRWTIRPDGNVTNIQTVTADFQHTPLSACLAAGIKKFKFPPYTGAQMAPINFPFKF